MCVCVRCIICIGKMLSGNVEVDYIMQKNGFFCPPFRLERNVDPIEENKARWFINNRFFKRKHRRTWICQ